MEIKKKDPAYGEVTWDVCSGVDDSITSLPPAAECSLITFVETAITTFFALLAQVVRNPDTRGRIKMMRAIQSHLSDAIEECHAIDQGN